MKKGKGWYQAQLLGLVNDQRAESSADLNRIRNGALYSGVLGMTGNMARQGASSYQQLSEWNSQWGKEIRVTRAQLFIGDRRPRPSCGTDQTPYTDGGDTPTWCVAYRWRRCTKASSCARPQHLPSGIFARPAYRTRRPARIRVESDRTCHTEERNQVSTVS